MRTLVSNNGFEMVFTDDHAEQVQNKRDEQVLKDLEAKLEEKRRQVSWVSKVPQLGQRLHNLVAGNRFGAVAFESRRHAYRAYFAILEDRKALVFISCVEKEDSYSNSDQRILRDGLEENHEDVLEYAKRVVDEAQGDAAV